MTDQPRTVVARLPVHDQVFVQVARAIGVVVLIITSAIGLFLGYQAIPTLGHYGFSFFTENRWLPSQDIIGISSVALGTVQVAIIGLLFSIPLAVLTALYITDWAPVRFRSTLIGAVDLMAAVPGIVFGLWVLFIIQPHATHITHWISKYFGWFPLFHVDTDVNFPIWDQAPGYASYAGSAAIAAICVAMMTFPMATSVFREVFAEAPPGEKEAVLALGGTRWAVARTVVLPFGKAGIVGGTMLALGRALGETISVVLVISQAFDLKLRPLESGTSTISSLIAMGYKEATPVQLSALLTAGFLLFTVTLVLNSFAGIIVARARGSEVTEI